MSKNRVKQTEAGEIPEGWEIQPAEKFCPKVTDGTHDSPQKQNKGKYLITSRHLKEGALDFNNAYYIAEEDYIEINRRSKVDQWDVIFSMIGTVGETYLEKRDDINYAIKNVGLFKSGKNELIGKWLFYYFKSNIAREYIHRSKAGTTQEYLTLESLRKFPILFPANRTMMSKIIGILDSIQDKIELNRQMNRTLESIAQAIFKRWFVDCKTVASFDWQVDDLGKHIEFSKGKKPSKISEKYSEGYKPQILIENLDGHPSLYTDDNGMIDVEINEPIMVMDGASSGRVEIGHSGILGSTLAKVVVTSDKISNLFLYYFLKNKELDINQNTTGTSIPHTDKEKIKRYQCNLPPKDLLKSFNDIAIKFLHRIIVNKNEIKTLAKIRDSLLPKLMSGKIRTAY